MLGTSDGFPFIRVEVRDRMNPHQLGSLMTFPKSARSTSSALLDELRGRGPGVPGWAVSLRSDARLLRLVFVYGFVKSGGWEESIK